MKLKRYLNTVELNDKYSKTFKYKANLKNEALVYEKLNIPFELKWKTITRPLFKGSNIKTWNPLKLQLLKEAISTFHTLNSQGFKVHNWFKYKKYLNKLSKKEQIKFCQIVKSLSKKTVVSHNDLNEHNVLWDGNRVILIDFEWTNLNHPLFDEVQFYIAEKTFLDPQLQKHPEFKNLYFISLCYFLMWTYAMPTSDYVLSLRSKYLELLKNL